MEPVAAATRKPKMQQILIACGDVELLKKIVADVPQDQYKPIATKKGGGIAEKIANRDVPVAIIYEQLQDGSAGRLCQELQGLPEPPAVMLLVSGKPPKEGPFDTALRYPVPGPVLRAALKRLAPQADEEENLEKWRAFYRELKDRLNDIDNKSYYQMLGLERGAPHHQLVSRFDAFSHRYHPDRYNKNRDEKWGQAIYEMANTLYKQLTEAFTVLSDRRLRKRYDEALGRGEIRLSSEETAGNKESGPRSIEEMGNSKQSKKFLKLAQSDIARQDWAAALQNLNFALSMEPDNEGIKAKIEEIEAKS